LDFNTLGLLIQHDHAPAKREMEADFEQIIHLGWAQESTLMWRDHRLKTTAFACHWQKLRLV
jgi:hypothetical protein